MALNSRVLDNVPKSLGDVLYGGGKTFFVMKSGAMRREERRIYPTSK